jgi:hypothetical protein
MVLKTFIGYMKAVTDNHLLVAGSLLAEQINGSVLCRISELW